MPGVLSFGAIHISKESADQYGAQEEEKGFRWEKWWVETKLSGEELKQAGVHAGSKVVVARSRKEPVVFGDFISGYSLDDKGSIPILLALAEAFAASPPRRDTVLAITSAEEVGGLGAVWIAHQESPELTIAVEIAPVMPEYQVENNANPVLLYQDYYLVYEEEISRALAAAAARLGIEMQYAAVSNYGSDASIAKHLGHTARAAAICFPTENTHGWEISNISAIENVTRVLQAYLSEG